ncbi:MAG TPA: DUF4339 domain-containing protein [Verrucomicrobiae bacterium]|nr:DUF4339 domain-containing protein [Verrucomicrobiae bacterium]
MNYYMARDGTTYGPYPQESFPTMLAAGQVVPEDLVCPEGGADWVPLSSIPGLSGAASPALAMPAAATPSLPRLRMSTSTSAPASHPATTPAASTPSFPRQTFPQHRKTGTMEKLAGAWGLLRIAGYGIAALVVVGVLIAGFFAAQRDKKEIAKLHSEAGWSAFDAANSRINSESANEGYGNTGEAGRIAKDLAAGLEAVQRENFKIESRPRYRGRSKLGRIASAVSSATAGAGHFQTYMEMRDDRVLVLVHVPEFSRYKGEVKESMLELCWGAANAVVAENSKVEPPKPPPPARPATTRPPAGRTAAAPAAPPAAPEPKVKDLTLIVGVRGKSAYEAVYVSKLNASDEADAPTPIRKNVPGHQALVKWFGTEKPEPVAAGP